MRYLHFANLTRAQHRALVWAGNTIIVFSAFIAGAALGKLTDWIFI